MVEILLNYVFEYHDFQNNHYLALGNIFRRISPTLPLVNRYPKNHLMILVGKYQEDHC
jgi:hypothetical protein